jgi:signal transduction histidine kinase
LTRLSLRWRLVVAGAAAIIVALGLAAAGLAALFSGHVERRAIAELEVHMDQVLAGLTRNETGDLLVAPPADPRFRQPYGGLYWQIDLTGKTLRSRSLWDYSLELPADDIADGAAHVHRIAGPGNASLVALERLVSLPEPLGGGHARAAVALEAAELDAARNAFIADLALYLVLLAAVLIAAGWAQVGIGLRPMRRIGSRIAAIRSGRAHRIGGDWPAEVRPLATELDGLLAAREADIVRARARAGDLAHGLKTPLQALMGEAGRLSQAGDAAHAESIEAIARSMQRHVDRELARTRVAAEAATARSDPSEVCRRVVAVARRTATGERVTWHLDGESQSPMVAIDAADLAEALGALVENAARHAQTRIELAVRHAAGHVSVAVRDDGPGIAPDLLEKVTARGMRLDESGTGLGLAIAADIAEAAGGRLALANREKGLEASLLLPVAAP